MRQTEAVEDSYSFKPAYVEELEKKLADSKRNLDEVMASYREHKDRDRCGNPAYPRADSK